MPTHKHVRGCLYAVCVYVCVFRLPLEAESAALGAALQAAAVHNKVPVGKYVQENQPPISDKVRCLAADKSWERH